MKSKRYSPVLITVYDRLDHFKRCISSLKSNVGAEKTTLFIAIDAPYRDEDIQKNKKVVEFSKSIKGFAAVELIIRDKNVGAIRNSFLARDEIFAKHSALIRAEDDNLFSPFFLDYMNTGLIRFEDDPLVFSICGYSEPVNLSCYLESDVYLRRGFSSYGFGIWKDKVCQVDWAADEFYRNFTSPSCMLNFWRSVGQNVFVGLLVAKKNRRTYGDMSIIYHIYKSGMYSVFPKGTLVRNIGQDGSGLHSGFDEVMQNQEILSGQIKYPDKFIYEEPAEVRRVLNDYYRQSFEVLLKYVPYYHLNFIKSKFVGSSAV